ncbi:MAG: metallophosphoesterase family protein [Deltaproteobacteria bacterium]|jgi:Icc-related predicted phosphoesterase|nr:metallophosphoesterase family protein [Deltaproteobacteria bacterium]
MPSSEHWIVFGDLHGDVHNVEEIIDLDEASGVILTGDLTFMGGISAGSKVLEAIASHNHNIYAQIGNMDKPELTGHLKKHYFNLHGEAQFIHPEITAIGLGGAPRTPFNTPSEFSEEEIGILLKHAFFQAGEYKNLVLISHSPPADTACDCLENGTHVGSRTIRKFIEQVQPALCLCGHIHESKAVDRIGGTVVINPGALTDGGYVMLALSRGKLCAGLCDLHEGSTRHCLPPMP